MDLRITLEAKSPLMIGGRKLGGDYNRSMDFVPGDVLRAALAQAILDRCDCFEPMQKDGPRFWVNHRDKKVCKSCSVNEWCKLFSDIIFRPAYPGEVRPIPVTARQCKYHKSHKLVDLLLYNLRAARPEGFENPPKCPECGERLESLRADFASHDGHPETLSHQFVIRSGKNPFTGTSQNGVLYSLDYLSEWQKGRRLRFITDWTLPWSVSSLDPFNVLRVGAYSRSGMGKLEVQNVSELSFSQNEEVNNLKQRIERFQEYINSGENGLVISLTLWTDVDLGLNNIQKKGEYSLGMGDGQVLMIIQDALNKTTGMGFKLMEFIGEHQVRRGWDTSGSNEGQLRDIKLWTLRGSVFVVSLGDRELKEDVLRRLYKMEKEGIGTNRETGFGQVRICDEFHLTMAPPKGGKKNVSE